MNHTFAQDFFRSRFQELERDMLHADVFMYSLNTKNSSASSPSVLAQYVSAFYSDTAIWSLFSDFLEQMFRNMIHHFPENIFWDLDYMITYAVRESIHHKAPELFWEDYTEKLSELLAIFGCHGEIRFRYLHDFTYGFDWSRWARKDISERKNIHPFGISFFDRTIERGDELLELIRKNDSKYHQLQSDVYRNPFSFSREIAEEKKMMHWLSKNKAIPVEQWKTTAAISFEKDVDLIRQRYSSSM